MENPNHGIRFRTPHGWRVLNAKRTKEIFEKNTIEGNKKGMIEGNENVRMKESLRMKENLRMKDVNVERNVYEKVRIVLEVSGKGKP